MANSPGPHIGRRIDEHREHIRARELGITVAAAKPFDSDLFTVVVKQIRHWIETKGVEMDSRNW